MKIEKGRHRVVIISHYLTIKFPRVFNFWKILGHLFTKNRRAAWFDLRVTTPRTFLRGLRENLNEFSCWKENRANFLVPVYFSIGIIEIQKTDRSEEISETEIDQIWESLISLAKNEIWRADSHTLANRLNYHRDGNQYRLVDYGGHGMGQFIRKHKEGLEKILNSS